jgi:hypothetical protein
MTDHDAIKMIIKTIHRPNSQDKRQTNVDDALGAVQSTEGKTHSDAS